MPCGKAQRDGFVKNPFAARLYRKVFASECNERSNLINIIVYQDCHVHWRELAMGVMAKNVC